MRDQHDIPRFLSNQRGSLPYGYFDNGDSSGPYSISFDAVVTTDENLVVQVEQSTTLQATGPGAWNVVAARIGNGSWTGTAGIEIRPAGEGLETLKITAADDDDPDRIFYRLNVPLLPNE